MSEGQGDTIQEMEGQDTHLQKIDQGTKPRWRSLFYLDARAVSPQFQVRLGQ